jgi:hypothetical protein
MAAISLSCQRIMIEQPMVVDLGIPRLTFA